MRGGGGLDRVTILLSSSQVPTLSIGRHLLHPPEERQEGQQDTLVEQDVQQGCPFWQKSGWWNCPTIMLVQTGHSSSATIMAESERVLVEGDGHSSSAVKYSKEEDDWLELELFILDCSPAVLSLMTAGCFILQ